MTQNHFVERIVEGKRIVMGVCPGCGDIEAKLVIDNKPGPACISCLMRIQQAELKAASIKGIRMDMEEMGIPLRPRGESEFIHDGVEGT